MHFRDDIEGLRAVAVCLVLAFHSAPALLPGGYVGVDVFFVISGYLITSLLLGSLREGTYSIADFYCARIRRLLPALVFMLLCATAAALVLLPPTALAEFGRTMVSSALFVSNIHFYRLSDYFSGAAELKPLLHTWSLAVEEHFYILFPLALAAAYRFMLRNLALAMAVAVTISFIATVWTANTDPALSFYFSGTRAFELLSGAWLAATHSAPKRRRPWPAAAGLLGVSLVVATALAGAATNHVVSAGLSCAGTILVIGSGDASSPSIVFRLLALKAVRAVGRASYSIYLWHWPILVFLRHFVLNELSGRLAVAAVVAAVAAGFASQRWIEVPARRRAWSRRTTVFVTVSSTALLCCMGWLLSQRQGWPERFDEPSRRFFAASDDVSPFRAACHGGELKTIDYASHCVFGDAQTARRIAVWGDSHGVEIAPALGMALSGHGLGVIQITYSSCPPAIGFRSRSRPSCDRHNASTLRSISNDETVDMVLLTAFYVSALGDDEQGLRSGLSRTIAELTRAGKRVALLGPIPNHGYSAPYALGMLAHRSMDPKSYGQSAQSFANKQTVVIEMINELVAIHGVDVVDIAALVCSDRWCPAFAAGVVLYFDEHHLSASGASILAARLAPQILDRLSKTKQSN